jgi:hypothetical protein
VEEIREDIAATRDTISNTVDKLGTRLQAKLDWREYVADHPLAALGAAAGLGLLVSRIFQRRPSPRERILDALAESVEDVGDQFRESVQRITDVVKPRNHRSSITQATTVAVGGAITKAAASFLKKKLVEGIDEGSTARPIAQTTPIYRPQDDPRI